MRISDWSSDVCSSDLEQMRPAAHAAVALRIERNDRPCSVLRVAFVHRRTDFHGCADAIACIARRHQGDVMFGIRNMLLAHFWVLEKTARCQHSAAPNLDRQRLAFALDLYGTDPAALVAFEAKHGRFVP